MIDLLRSLVDWVVCLVQSLVCFIADGAVLAVNRVIAALAAVVAAALAAWPITMPGLPTMPAALETALGWVAFFFPLETLAQVLLFLVTAMLAWMALAILLRWVRAIGD